MDYILTYLIFPFSANDESALRWWLDCGHYPNAVDHQRGRIIVFNICSKAMLRFVAQFGISEWTFGQLALPPEEYSELFRYYDSKLGENLCAYRSFFAGDGCADGRSTTLSTAFDHDGYRSWRIRYYLTKGLLGLSTDDFTVSGYSYESIFLKKVEAFTIECQEAVNKFTLGDDSSQSYEIDIWVDFSLRDNIIRCLYIGWFVSPFDMTRDRDSLTITLQMEKWLRKRDIPRDTVITSEIKRFLTCIGTDIADISGENQPGVKRLGKSTSDEQSSFVSSTFVVPYGDKESELKLCNTSFPTAIDADHRRLLLFNQYAILPEILRRLKECSEIRTISVTHSELPEYSAVYKFINDTINKNLSNVGQKQRWVTDANHAIGWSSFYHRRRCYAGLQGVNLNEIFQKSKI